MDTSEDSKDTITPMMLLNPDDPVWIHRAVLIAELMEERWTGINQKGARQFKSTYFNVHEVHKDEKKACDTVWHPGVVQPSLIYWLRSHDEKLSRLFSSWMDTWVDVTLGNERGKPAGVIPSAIHWPKGLPGGLEGVWYEPDIDQQAHLYNWPGNMTMLTSTLLLTYQVTGDEKYLQPIHSMARLRREYRHNKPEGEIKPGSKHWCASKMGFMGEILAKYRALTGDKQYDDMLLEDASGYVRYRIDGKKDALIRHLEHTVKAMRANWPGYTSEVRWTDRVLSFPSKYVGYYDKEYAHRPNSPLLYAMATGDMGRVDYFPINSVRWLTAPRQIAAMVISSGSDHIHAEVYHFGERPRIMGAELYLLSPGQYKLIVETDGKELFSKDVKVKSARTRISFQLPAKQLVSLRLE